MSEILSNKPSFWARYRKKLVFGGCGIFLLGLGYLMWWYLTQPVQGTVRKVETSVSSMEEKNLKKRLYQGKYVTFSHEGSYEERSHEVPERGPVQESILLTSSAIDGRKIAVTVANRGTSDLSSDPSYQVRDNDRTQYKRTPFAVASYEGVLFETNEAPFEMVAFFAYRGVIVSIALSSLFRPEGLTSELDALLSDFSISVE